MKRYVPTCVVALLLVTVLAMPGHAEEPAAQVPAAASQPSSDVARPALVPARAEPAAPSASLEVPRRHRRYVHGHHRSYGMYRAAFIPVLYWPRNKWPRIEWQRMIWPFRFG
jgi:hypothetical protein